MRYTFLSCLCETIDMLFLPFQTQNSIWAKKSPLFSCGDKQIELNWMFHWKWHGKGECFSLGFSVLKPDTVYRSLTPIPRTYKLQELRDCSRVSSTWLVCSGCLSSSVSSSKNKTKLPPDSFSVNHAKLLIPRKN